MSLETTPCVSFCIMTQADKIYGRLFDEEQQPSQLMTLHDTEVDA